MKNETRDTKVISDRVIREVKIGFLALFTFSFSTVYAGGVHTHTGNTSADSVGVELTQQQQLGKYIFFDTNLSVPAGQSCGSCHSPDFGFADPDSHFPVSEGAVYGRFGTRNTPSAAYASFSPLFRFVNNNAVGGLNWDGRAADLAEQAKDPFLNPVEMNNPNKESVIYGIQSSNYGYLFEELCGYTNGSTVSIDDAYNCMSESIAAYQRSAELNPFTSKFDYVEKGKAKFTAQEAEGLALFNGKAWCFMCHTTKGGMTPPIVFSDFRYYNLGVPKNNEFPFGYYSDPDLGIGSILNIASQEGKFKVPVLRNAALTPPYMHNGVFKSLKEVVYFYNKRDVSDYWGVPEVSRNVQTRFIGDLGLSGSEEDAIVAFIKTFSDGYQVDTHGVGGHKHDGHKKHSNKRDRDHDKHSNKHKHDDGHKKHSNKRDRDHDKHSNKRKHDDGHKKHSKKNDDEHRKDSKNNKHDGYNKYASYQYKH